MTADNAEYRHFLVKARVAKRDGQDAGGVMSRGEKVAVALVLNRADWLASIDFTLAEAIDRTGPEWLALVPQVVRALQDEA
ncbi:MAG: hypothetical protein JWR60_2678 [Polaromonas sp.]|nr:hypothetical protein [Polaromonas sp.]